MRPQPTCANSGCREKGIQQLGSDSRMWGFQIKDTISRFQKLDVRCQLWMVCAGTVLFAADFVHAAPPTFRRIGVLPQHSYAHPTAVSGDGTIVIGRGT